MKTLIAFMHLYIANTNTHNFILVQAMIHEKAVYWFDEIEYKDQDSIEGVFLSTWKYVPDEIYAIRNLQWLSIDNNSALCVYDYEWKGSHNNKIVQGFGRGSNLLVKEKGEWKIMFEHLSKRK